MSNIDEKLNQILQIKSDIKDAITEKGVEVYSSLPFSLYPSKIREISSGGSIEYTDPLFDTYGELTIEDNGIYSGFNLNRSYIYNVFTRNNKSCIYRLKVKTSSDPSGEQYVLQSDYVNLFLVNSKFGAYSRRESHSYQVYPVDSDTWYYISIKIEATSSGYSTHSVYISTEKFSTEDSDLSFSYTEYVSSSDSGKIGCHQNNVGYFKGKIDMRESVQFTLDGAIIRPYVAFKILNS